MVNEIVNDLITEGFEAVCGKFLKERISFSDLTYASFDTETFRILAERISKDNEDSGSVPRRSGELTLEEVSQLEMKANNPRSLRAALWMTDDLPDDVISKYEPQIFSDDLVWATPPARALKMLDRIGVKDRTLNTWIP